MIVHVQRIVPMLFSLALASAPTQAKIYKCRQGERVIYQEVPCPAGSQPVAALDEAPQPSAYEAAQARARAKGEIGEAAAIRKRDEKAAAALEKKRVAARKQETDCTRLLDRVTKAEDKEALTKAQKSALKSEQRKYRKDCGPL